MVFAGGGREGAPRTKLLAFSVFVFLLCGTNVLTFWSHYTGSLIFPWDFLGGYHSHAVAWFADGSVLHPPKWFPYGSMGFPAWWSLQSGGWYLPLQLMHWLGLPYTLVGATAFQSAHVAVGAIGTFLLARASGVSLIGAGLGAGVYHFSSIFFSNQEHVDFIRGAALFPWLLHSFHPKILLRHRAMVLWSAVVLWQFLVCAYPGAIIAAGYTTLLVVACWLSASERRGDYLVALICAGMAGTLMSLVKWLTPILLAVKGFEPKPGISSFRPEHIFTFLFRYNLPHLPQELTMQSLWSPPAALLLLVFSKPGSRLAWLAFALITLALLSGSLETTAPALRKLLPGFTISRAVHSDWRPTLHLGFALLSGCLFDAVISAKFSGKEILLRTSVGISVLVIFSLGAMYTGYNRREIFPELAIFAIAILCCTLCLLASDWIKGQNTHKAIITCVIAAFIATTSFLQHGIEVSQTWKVPWSDAAEKFYFGSTVFELIEQPRRTVWQRRPPRTSYELDPRSSVAEQVSAKYNRAWYAQEFGTFGYDNLASPEFKDFLWWLKDPSAGNDLLEFMTHPGQVVFYKVGEGLDLRFAASCERENHSCSQRVEASGNITSYGLLSTTYEVRAAGEAIMVENEMFYRGWKGMLCDSTGSCREIRPSAGLASLRSWAIPPGDWRLTISYAQPFFRASVMAFFVGLGLALAFWLVPARWIVRSRRLKAA